MATSIFHRATGIALSGGLLLLVGWLLALAGGPESYAGFAAFAGSWPVKALLGLLLLSFCYHCANGIRHLSWDAGFGMERAQARLSAKLVVAFVVISAPLLIYLLLIRGTTP
jgi:succinate dehydrogenase / fumarate reductase cytochrome b subunit